MNAYPSLKELLDTMHVVQLPMHTTFRGVNTREIALFHGPTGWSEFSPFLEYGVQESAAWLASAIEYGWKETPEPVRKTVSVNATLPAVTPKQVKPLLEKYGTFNTVKIKVAEPGQHLTDDLNRVAKVRQLYPNTKIRLDANMAWTVNEAKNAIEQLSVFDLEYVEQPCATVRDLAAVRKSGLGVKIAADESIRKATDPYLVASEEAADIVILKVQPLGGIQNCLTIANNIGLPVVVSSALDSSIGLSAGVALAAALPTLPYANGLGTAALFTQDITQYPLKPVHGSLDIQRPKADPALLTELAVPIDRYQHWKTRVTECYRHLETGNTNR